MKLSEIIENIDSFDEEGSIFASKVNGKYDSSSEAEVLEMSDEELQLSTAEVAQKRCPGKSYFLEVFLVQEFLEDWVANHDGKQPSIEDACHCLIYYAENDCYPKEFFS